MLKPDPKLIHHRDTNYALPFPHVTPPSMASSLRLRAARDICGASLRTNGEVDQESRDGRLGASAIETESRGGEGVLSRLGCVRQCYVLGIVGKSVGFIYLPRQCVVVATNRRL